MKKHIVEESKEHHCVMSSDDDIGMPCEIHLYSWQLRTENKTLLSFIACVLTSDPYHRDVALAAILKVDPF